MVKTRHIPEVGFAAGARPRVEVVGLRALLGRRLDLDLRAPQRPLFHHLFFVSDGPGQHTVDFRARRLVPGQVLHVAPGQVQQFSFDARLDARMVVFEPEVVRRAPGVWTAPRPARRPGAAGALVALLAAEVAAWDGSAAADALLAALVEALLLAVGDAPDPAGGALYVRFTAALERSFRRAREAAAYAAILDCAPRTLSRACEAATGKSTKQLIDERVALEARRLLAHGGDSATDIAAALGFAEATQFGKFFRRLCGETPVDFRARYRARRTTDRSIHAGRR